MNKYIRWPGLIVFLLIASALVGGSILFADVMVKNAIEYTGTSMVGAKVEVDRVELSLSPLGFRVMNLQVTDSDKPMVNAFQVDETEFFLDTHQLFRLKTVIPDMHVRRLRVNTERKESGAILQPVKKEKAEVTEDEKREKVSFPALALPELTEVFNREELSSVKHVNQLRVEVREAQDQWRTAFANVPNQDKVKDYELKFGKIKLGDSKDPVAYVKQLEKDIDILKGLRKEVKADYKSVNDARINVQARFSQLQKSLELLKTLPAEDVERIKSKYALSPSGLANISDLLFGEKTGYWTRKIIVWYDKLKPIYDRFEKTEEEEELKPERGKGINIPFPEHYNMPDFLIKKASISMEVPLGKISGEVRNMTGQQSVLGHPMTFQFFSKEMQDVQDVEIEGTFDHIKPRESRDTVKVKVRSVQAKDINVLKEDQFPLNLKSALIDYEINAELLSGKLSSKMNAVFRETDFDVPFSAKPPRLAKAMAAAMDDVPGFNAQVGIDGTLRKYKVSIRSSLDKVLRDAIGAQVQVMAREFKQRIRAELENRLKEPLAEYRREEAKVKATIKRLQNIEGEIQNLDKNIEKRIQEFVKEKKKKLNRKKQAAEDKAKAKAAAKKKAEKKKAKKKSDDKKKALEKQLKNKLGL